MLRWVENSLRNRLLVAFLTVGFIPIAIFVIYMLFLSQNKIVEKSMSEEHDRIEKIEQIIEMHLYQLNKEIGFLSRLEIMDDVVTEDLDKRITTLLEKKVKDLALDVVAYVLDADGRVIAATKKNFLPTFFPDDEKGYVTQRKELYFYSRIYASYDSETVLGYLVLRYNLENLKLFLNSTEHIHTFLLSGDERYTIAKSVSFRLHPNKTEYIDDEHLIVYKALNGFLSGWYLVYAVDRSIALAFLYDFLRFMFSMIPLIVVVIIIGALNFSKKITTPIERLTELTDTITKTKNFDTKIVIASHDEIGRLSRSFNLMLRMTDKALKELRLENELRLRRFIHLTEIFNSIMKTDTTEECVLISTQKLKELSKEERVEFIKERAQGCIALETTNYESGEKKFFGSLCIGERHLEDENERRFFLSIAQMISLQLDRIILVDKTTAASKAKSAFISNMSHELRTPLNAIIGFTQYLLAYEELNEEQNEIVENIESSAQYLLSMINDILDMAKIETGKMETHIEEVAIVSVVKDIASMLSPLIEEKSLDFTLSIELDEEFVVQTDAKMYKQIAINLLSNAIKFTQEGMISVCLCKRKDRLCFEVVDTGIGIGEENLHKLFNDFTQVENVMQKKHKGTGLGLSLSKKMAQLLGGDVELHSDGEGKGTKAIFRIKVANV